MAWSPSTRRLGTVILLSLSLVLAVAISVQSYRRLQRRWRCEAYLDDLRTWVPRCLSQPAEVPNQLRAVPDTPWGGRYFWVPAFSRLPDAAGAILISGFTPSSKVEFSAADWEQLQASWKANPIPRARLVEHFNRWPACVLEKKP